MKVSELIPTLVPVPKAHNLEAVGWKDGYMIVRFQGRSQMYVYGSDIPESVMAKLLANPFPDALFSKLKKHWKCFKVVSKVEGSGVATPDYPTRLSERA